MGQPQWIYINEISDYKQVQSSFTYRCLPRDNCCTMIEQLLDIPEVYVLAVGSRSCLHFMYSAAEGKPGCRRLFYIPQSLEECVDSGHLESVEEAVRQAVRQGAKGVIVYLCCADVLIGTDFIRLCTLLEAETGVLVRPLYRGIVATRRQSALGAVMDIIQDLFIAAPESRISKERSIALLSKRRLDVDSELFGLLQDSGYEAVTNHCESMEEFLMLAGCPTAVALDSYGDMLAEMLQKHFGTQILRIHAHFDPLLTEKELEQLSAALGLAIKWETQRERLQAALSAALAQPANRSIAVGCESDNFELAACLLALGLHVDIVFCDAIASGDVRWINDIAAHNPHLMVCFDSRLNERTAMPELQKISTAVGTKAGFFCGNARRLPQAEEVGFGYEKLIKLLEGMA